MPTLLLAALVATIPCPPCSAQRILWADTVELTVADFRGPLGDTRHAAEANTGIKTRSRAGEDARTFVVEAETFFDPCQSWFRRGRGTAADSSTLAHERIHFDIAEVFARRLLRRYAEEIDSHAEFLRRHDRIYDEVWREVDRTQQRYDREVYDEPAATARWRAWADAALAEEAEFAAKSIELPMSGRR